MWGHERRPEQCLLTSAKNLRSCTRLPPRIFSTFFAPSATAASMRRWCLSSSIRSSKALMVVPNLTGHLGGKTWQGWKSTVDLRALSASLVGCISYLKHVTCWIHCIFHPSCWLRYFHNVHADYFNLCLAVLEHLLSCSQQLPLLPKGIRCRERDH